MCGLHPSESRCETFGVAAAERVGPSVRKAPNGWLLRGPGALPRHPEMKTMAPILTELKCAPAASYGTSEARSRDRHLHWGRRMAVARVKAVSTAPPPRP